MKRFIASNALFRDMKQHQTKCETLFVVSRPSELSELPRAYDSTPDDIRRQINSLGIESLP